MAGLDPLKIRDAAIRALTPRPEPRIDLFHVAPIRVSVADAVAELVDELPRVGRITFARLTAALVERLDVIVRFLAVLELFKQGMVDVDQADRFGDIRIEWTGAPPTRTPRRSPSTSTKDDRPMSRRQRPPCGRSRRSCSSPTEPVAPELLAQLLEQPVVDVERWCNELAAVYEEQGRGFQLVRIAGGYRLQTHPDLTPYVERFLLHDQRARLSGAALETLAIVAYKQPISRAQIASIRGVDPDGVLRTLQARGYIDAVGHDPGPGQAMLYGTTPTFLEKLGLDRIDDLPPIAEFIPGADVRRGPRGRAADHR